MTQDNEEEFEDLGEECEWNKEEEQDGGDKERPPSYGTIYNDYGRRAYA